MIIQETDRRSRGVRSSGQKAGEFQAGLEEVARTQEELQKALVDYAEAADPALDELEAALRE